MSTPSDEIKPILPKGKPVRTHSVGPVQRKVSAEKGKKSLPVDEVQLDPTSREMSSDDVKVSPERMEGYIRLLKEMPGVRSEEISRVKANVEEGAYGREALEAIVDGVIDG